MALVAILRGDLLLLDLRGVAVGRPRALNGGLMKTAFQLLLLSASFLSANLFAESEWVSTPFQPGLTESYQLVSMTMSQDGQIILIAEKAPDGTTLQHRGTKFWRSTDAGKNWSVLTYKTK